MNYTTSFPDDGFNILLDITWTVICIIILASMIGGLIGIAYVCRKKNHNHKQECNPYYGTNQTKKDYYSNYYPNPYDSL